MLASFDDRGRLFVADSAGVNLRGPELSKNPPHVIRMLEDTDGDGRFDKSTVFADKLVFPQGVVWHDGAVYCSSPPSFWRLDDTDGDGVADKREELATGFANTGVADDMHGGSLGPDGRLYWCAGRFPHEIHRPGGPVDSQGHRAAGAALPARRLRAGSRLRLAGQRRGRGLHAARATCSPAARSWRPTRWGRPARRAGALRRRRRISGARPHAQRTQTHRRPAAAA